MRHAIPTLAQELAVALPLLDVLDRTRLMNENCPALCGRQKTAKWHLLCSACWKLIPTIVQNELYGLYKTAKGSPEHIAKCVELIRYARERQAERNAE